MKKLILFFIASIGMMACSDDIPVQKNVEYQTVYSDSFTSNFQNIGNKKITTQEEWIELKNVLNELGDKNISSHLNDISNNFNDYHLLFIIKKDQPHTGCNLNVSSVVENNNAVELKTSIECTGAGFTAITDYFVILKIKATNKEVLFN